MILRYSDILNKIEINKITTLVIENPKLFRNILFDINSIEDTVSLYEGSNELDINKNVIIFNSLFDISENNSKIIKELYNETESEINSLYAKEYLEMNNKIIEFVNNIVISSKYDLVFDNNIELIKLFKLINLRFIDIYDKENLLEKTINIIKLISNLLKDIKLVIFINIRSLFTNEEYDIFCNEIKYLNINVLFIENTNKLDNHTEKLYIIDNQLCEICGY